MEDSEMLNLWKSANEKLEKNPFVIKKNPEDITGIKVHNYLTAMKPIKIFTLLAGIVWVIIGGIVVTKLFVFSFAISSKFFLFSAAIHLLLTAIAIFIYLYQLITIYNVDKTDPILKTQKKLAALKTSMLWVTRILFLQLPVWTTFWWNETIFQKWNLLQWAIPVTVTILFTYFAIWLFFNIKYENRNKKWFKLIFNGKEWTPLMKSMELLEQLDEYKTGIEPETNAST
jgi:glucan phosphoethanolaminetransferase (alkaline phosphatase superfamily)